MLRCIRRRSEMLNTIGLEGLGEFFIFSAQVIELKVTSS